MEECGMAHVEIDVEKTIREMSELGIPPYMRRVVLEGMEWMDDLYGTRERDHVRNDGHLPGARP
jgi:hypothetical protein